jgi:hypothetical protein
MYMPVIDGNKLTRTKAYKAVKKSIKKYASEIGEKGLVRATQDRIGSAMETVSERLSHISAFFKNVYGKLKREWKSLRSPLDKVRVNWLAASISHVQDSIHKQIHGELLTYADVRSWAGEKQLQNDVLQTFRWRFELMGKSTGEMDEFETAIRQDNMNLTVINYLVEILCEDLPSFRVFIYGSEQEKNSRIAEIQAKIDQCLSGVDEFPQDHMDTASVKRPAQGYYRISPNATMEDIKQLSALSAKPEQNKEKMFKKMKKRTIKNLIAKKKYVNTSRKLLEKRNAEKMTASAPVSSKNRGKPAQSMQPGFGQPGFGQPGFGQPGFGQPGFGQMSVAPLMNPNAALGKSMQAPGPQMGYLSDGEVKESPKPKGRSRGRATTGVGKKKSPVSPPQSTDSPYRGEL